MDRPLRIAITALALVVTAVGVVRLRTNRVRAQPLAAPPGDGAATLRKAEVELVIAIENEQRARRKAYEEARRARGRALAAGAEGALAALPTPPGVDATARVLGHDPAAYWSARRRIDELAQVRDQAREDESLARFRDAHRRSLRQAASERPAEQARLDAVIAEIDRTAAADRASRENAPREELELLETYARELGLDRSTP